ncbi:MAG TPA: response regulator transcription factor [Vicinamibacterales bacterium]
MRASLNGSIRVVGEFPTLAAAETAGIEADGVLLSRTVRLKPDTTYDHDPFDGVLPEPLTPREIEVLELLAEGLANKAIAGRLGISDQTVKFHVASISGKLGATNRTDAVRRAVRRGLITL